MMLVAAKLLLPKPQTFEFNLLLMLLLPPPKRCTYMQSSIFYYRIKATNSNGMG
jgi:hypothetical protein